MFDAYFKSIILNPQFSCQVFAWGSNECGQLGFDDVEERRIPALVPALSGTESRTGGTETRTAQIACGQQHSAAVLEGGELLTWGCGRSGQLGHASEPSRQAPRRVQALADVFCTQVSARKVEKVTVLFFGPSGQLGHGPNPATKALQRTCFIRR